VKHQSFSLRTEPQNATVLTIAHRNQTIVDYDMIVILDHGEIAEKGRLSDLFEKQNGWLYRLAKEFDEE
jgi:ATP-binding cassette, subfamily C (CFTR/MRP), member 1